MLGIQILLNSGKYILSARENTISWVYFFAFCVAVIHSCMCVVFSLPDYVSEIKKKDFRILHHCIMNIKRGLQPKRQSRLLIRPKTTR